MSDATAELCAAAAGIFLVSMLFVWFALLPAVGLLWITGVLA